MTCLVYKLFFTQCIFGYCNINSIYQVNIECEDDSSQSTKQFCAWYYVDPKTDKRERQSTGLYSLQFIPMHGVPENSTCLSVISALYLPQCWHLKIKGTYGLHLRSRWLRNYGGKLFHSETNVSRGKMYHWKFPVCCILERDTCCDFVSNWIVMDIY